MPSGVCASLVPAALSCHASAPATRAARMSVRGQGAPRTPMVDPRSIQRHACGKLLPTTAIRPTIPRGNARSQAQPPCRRSPRRGSCSQFGPQPRLRCNQGVCAVNNQDWHAISRFESYDLVKAWYKETHGKEPNSAKISQVNAFFSQGREYFRNAISADLSVKPLLLYYGVLSLSRGAILLNDQSKKEESLKTQHGLQAVDWQETLSDGIKNVLELKVKATNGTFRELVDACRNRHVEHCFFAPGKTKVVVDHDLGSIRFATDDSLLTLGDLVSRLMQTTFDYQGIPGRKSQWFPVIVTAHSTETHFALLSPHVVDDLRGLVDGASVFLRPTATKSWPNLSIDTIPQFSLVFLHDDPKTYQRRFPVFHYRDGSPSMTGILDFPNQDKLSEFFKLYLTSFFLGMLARYYPSKWMGLLRNSPGDFARPLLLRAIEAVESDFPAELSQQVRAHPTTFVRLTSD